MIANIPKNVTYIWGKHQILGSFWEDDDIKTENKIEVLPAYCSDAENKKTLATGRYWAGRTNTSNSKEATFENTPMTNIRIISLEKRSEGGRAYKVIAERDGKSFYFDMREDVILDTMLEVGINKGAVLNGEFIWAVIGSQMKIIRVDSDLYKKAVESTNLKTLKKIKDLQVGGIYTGRNGKEMVYWGKFDYIDIFLDDKNSHSFFSRKDFNFNCSLKKNIMIFEHFPVDDNYKWFEFKTSHNLIQKVGNVDVPSDVVKYLKNYAINQTKKKQDSSYNDSRYYMYQNYAYYSKTALIANPEEEIIPPPEFDKLINEIKTRKEWI